MPTQPPPAPKPGGPRRVLKSAAIEQIRQKLRSRRRGKKANIRVAALNITSFLDMSFCLLMFLTLSAGAGACSATVTSRIPLSAPPADPDALSNICSIVAELRSSVTTSLAVRRHSGLH